MNLIAKTIDGIQEILAICPCCGEIFRLVEGKFIFPQTRPRTCDYTDLVLLENRAANESERVDSAEERFEQKLIAHRDELVELGLRKAKQKLKKIDPMFSGRNIDPQDVKVIFDPVEYVIFHGLNSEDGVEYVEFVSRSPESKTEEVIVKSINTSIKSGNVEFETLHMRDDGSFEIRKAITG